MPVLATWLTCSQWLMQFILNRAHAALKDFIDMSSNRFLITFQLCAQGSFSASVFTCVKWCKQLAHYDNYKREGMEGSHHSTSHVLSK